MSRILIRSKTSPLEPHSVKETLKGSLLGNNSGNLLFSYGVTRLFYSDENEVSFISDRQVLRGEVDPVWLNENFDYLILPLANSFRDSYITQLQAWTRLISSLTIPCVVVGIGVQLANGENVREKHSYDDAARGFIAAVLDHSCKVAVRGEITAAYLNNLGFSQLEVTGCPSFSIAGPKFPIDDYPALTEDAVVSVTGSVNSPESFQQLMRRTFECFKECFFVPQYDDDLALIYCGMPNLRRAAKRNGYPRLTNDPVFTGDRARAFVNIKSMLEFYRGTDFNYGTRIHGCIGNVVSGVPSLLFVQDQRVGELASYHHLPVFNLDTINDETNIFDLYEAVDLHYMKEGHAERFARLISFLDGNDLPHVWRNGFSQELLKADEVLKSTEFPGPVRSVLHSETQEELADRLAYGQQLAIKKVWALEKRVKELSLEVDSNR